MSLLSLLNAGSLNSISSLNAVNPLQSAQRLLPQKPQSADSSSTAQLAFDTYTPSQTDSGSSSTSGLIYSDLFSYGSVAQGQQSSSSQTSGSAGVSYGSTVTSSSRSGVPQAVLDLLAGENDPVQQSWSTLAQNLLSGDLTSAQSSLVTYTQNLANSNYGASSLTAPTAQFTNDLANLGSAIESGDSKGAMAAFETASTQAPNDVLGAMGMAVSQVQRDETQSMQTVAQTGGLSSTDISQLASDMTNLDSVKKEASANISSYLVTQGYSASDAATYANALTATSTTIATDIGSSVSSTGNGSYASASSQIGISVSEDAQGNITLISTVSTEARAAAQSASNAVNALDSAQTSAFTNIANWLVAQGYQALDASVNPGDTSSSGNVSAYA